MMAQLLFEAVGPFSVSEGAAVTLLGTDDWPSTRRNFFTNFPFTFLWKEHDTLVPLQTTQKGLRGKSIMCEVYSRVE